jgi:hypothetical protein
VEVPSIIDFEASGFGSHGYPIEVGFVLGKGQRFCTLIKPPPQWTYWCEQAAQIHGITREQLFAFGLRPAEVCARLDGALRGRTLYSDAWNYDLSWLHQLYDAAGRVPPFRLESTRVLFEEHEVAAWHPTREAVRKALKVRRHRASIDAMVVQVTLCRIKGLALPYRLDLDLPS